MQRKAAILLLILVVVALTTSACRRNEQPVSTAQDASQSSTATVPSSPGPAATNTRERPPPTFTAVPTMSPPPTEAPRPLPPTPLTSEAQFGFDRNRLTGELTTEPSLLQRRPIAVKISNSPAQYTRPQAGLGQADLVYEHVTEGSITRFTAIFYGQTPPKVGPIRSARLIDLELPAMYDAALAFSGSSIGVSRKLFGSDFRDRILRTYVAGYYRTGENKPYEHTLYAEPEILWQVLEERGQNLPPTFNSVMAFGAMVPAGGVVANKLTVRYLKFTTIEWRYDRSSGRYLRWVDGVEHRDANTGEQISAANVVLVTAPHRLDETICEYQVDNRCLAHSTEIQLWGNGPAVLLRDGRAFELTWNRQARHELLTLTDSSGGSFPLQFGNTWFQVMPPYYTDSFVIEP